MNDNATTSSLSAVQVQLRNLKRRTEDVSQLLKQQHQLLRQRGMNLPSSAIDGLRSLRSGLDNLSRSLLDSQVELQQLRRLVD